MEADSRDCSKQLLRFEPEGNELNKWYLSVDKQTNNNNKAPPTAKAHDPALNIQRTTLNKGQDFTF